MKKRIKYYVTYGSFGSREACYTLADVNAFIAHCLKTDVLVKGVSKA